MSKETNLNKIKDETFLNVLQARGQVLFADSNKRNFHFAAWQECPDKSNIKFVINALEPVRIILDMKAKKVWIDDKPVMSFENDELIDLTRINQSPS